MNILLTGASGFLGKHLKVFLKEDCHEVVTLGRTEKDDIKTELTTSFYVQESFNMVIHAAGKAHIIPKNREQKQEFFKVNVEGTTNLLNSLNLRLPNRFVFISSVSVYGVDSGKGIDEKQPLNAKTPYGYSKIQAEQRVEKWCLQNKVDFLILRLPLISGVNPPGNLGAMARAIKKGYYFRIGEAENKRSMVGIGDIAKLITKKELKSGTYNLTDGVHPSIRETENCIAMQFKKEIKEMPDWLVTMLAEFGDVIPRFPINSNKLSKLKNTLTFSDKKARKELGWHPESALKSLHFSNNV